MSTKIKSIGFIAFYMAPCVCIYLLSKYEIFELHKFLYPLAGNIPALTNYSFCTQSPEPIKALHLFNIFYSVVIPAILFRKAIINSIKISIKPVLITLPLVAFGLLIMFMGFELPSADGAGGYIAKYYCNSEIVSFIVLSLFSACTSVFYSMFFMFTYLFIKIKANKV